MATCNVRAEEDKVPELLELTVKAPKTHRPAKPASRIFFMIGRFECYEKMYSAIQ
jgi:hypothetical protein